MLVQIPEIGFVSADGDGFADVFLSCFGFLRTVAYDDAFCQLLVVLLQCEPYRAGGVGRYFFGAISQVVDFQCVGSRNFG